MLEINRPYHSVKSKQIAQQLLKSAGLLHNECRHWLLAQKSGYCRVSHQTILKISIHRTQKREIV